MQAAWAREAVRRGVALAKQGDADGARSFYDKVCQCILPHRHIAAFTITNREGLPAHRADAVRVSF